MKRFLPGSALLLVLGGAACGDVVGGGSELSASERAALAAAMVGRAASSTGPLANGAQLERSSGAAHDSQMQFAFGTSEPCSPSGTVALNGTGQIGYVDATRAGSLDATLTIVHTACGHPTQSGAPVVVTGDPSLTVALQAASVNGQVTALNVHETGAFTWTRGDGASGRCTVDLTAQLDPADGRVDFSGSFCGHPVQGSASRG